MSLSLLTIQLIANHKEGVPKTGENFKKVLLARGAANLKEPEYEHMFCMEALVEALKQSPKEGVPLKMLQQMRQLVLRGMEDVFRRGLTGKLPASVMLIQLR